MRKNSSKRSESGVVVAMRSVSVSSPKRSLQRRNRVRSRSDVVSAFASTIPAGSFHETGSVSAAFDRKGCVQPPTAATAAIAAAGEAIRRTMRFTACGCYAFCGGVPPLLPLPPDTGPLPPGVPPPLSRPPPLLPPPPAGRRPFRSVPRPDCRRSRPAHCLRRAAGCGCGGSGCPRPDRAGRRSCGIRCAVRGCRRGRQPSARGLRCAGCFRRRRSDAPRRCADALLGGCGAPRGPLRVRDGCGRCALRRFRRRRGAAAAERRSAFRPGTSSRRGRRLRPPRLRRLAWSKRVMLSSSAR